MDEDDRFDAAGQDLLYGARTIAILETPCAGCHRLVIHAKPKGKHVTCSDRCKSRVYHGRPLPAPIPCATCGSEFTPIRSDARYCSPKCRQAAYRQRRSDSDSPSADA